MQDVGVGAVLLSAWNKALLDCGFFFIFLATVPAEDVAMSQQ
jgi:hypothetical protein